MGWWGFLPRFWGVSRVLSGSRVGSSVVIWAAEVGEVGGGRGWENSPGPWPGPYLDSPFGVGVLPPLPCWSRPMTQKVYRGSGPRYPPGRGTG